MVDRAEQVEEACRELAKWPLIGFDTETRPSFKAGVSYKVSLIQLSTPKQSFLFRINKTGLAPEIISILEDSSIIKLGADVDGDIRSLNQLQEISPRGFYDLQRWIWEWGIGEKSLRKMSAIVLGHRISKAQRLSNWEAASLTPQQQTYAATDAWACIEIYNELQKRSRLTPLEIEALTAERAQKAAEAAAKKAEREKQRGKYNKRPKRGKPKKRKQDGE